MKTVCAIVLNYNGFADTQNCIISLQKCTYPFLDTIIVDNASTDESVKRINDEFPNITLLQSKHNGGYAMGMNIGINYALNKKYDYILILNNDTEVTEDFLQPMLIEFENNKNIGIVSPKVGYLENRNQIYCAGAEISTLLCGGVSKYKGKNIIDYANRNRKISMAEGCCFLVKREVFENMGLMDESFFMYFEEVEFSDRVNKKFDILYVSDSIIYHKGGGGKQWNRYTPLYYYYYTRNRFLFFRKKNFLIKLYVFIFASLNTIAKYLVLSKSKYFATFENKIRYNELRKSLKKGFYDGLKNFW